MSIPRRVMIDGEFYIPVLLRVEDRREDEPNVGLPSGVTIMLPDDVVELSEDLTQNVFHVAFVRETAFALES